MERKMAIEVVYVDPMSPGYQPVVYMVRLAAELLEAELIVLQSRSLGLIEKGFGLLPRNRRGASGLLICPSPADLASILLVKGWRKRYGCLVAWVFDSFWPEYVPRFVQLGRIFDHVFVTEREDLNVWREMMSAPVDWLPWGSDVFRLGSPNPRRPIDLLRFGRQPPEWEDDVSTASMCNSKQLRFQGRPTYFRDPSEGQRALMSVLGQVKFTLSFSNLVSGGIQTHPKRSYITARWTDALSAGAIVAGIPPETETVRALLWDGSLLNLRTLDRAHGLDMVANAAREWTPCRARQNYLRSLQILDWRWRFEKLALALEIHPLKLNEELSALRNTINPCP
jgi:hypothetical protein